MRKFMFDSNAFSSLLKSNVDWTTFFAEHKNEFEFFVTAIQVEELANIRDEKKEERRLHFLCLCYMNVKLVPTPAVVGESRMGMCILGEDKKQGKYTQLLNDKCSNTRDAMIGDAAYREGCTVIADDDRFIKKLKAENIPAMTFEEFCKTLGLDTKS